MTKEEKVRYWLDIADYDFDTAKAMHQTGRWLYVAFMCHQVIEKMSRPTGAVLAKRTLPTRIATSVWPMDVDSMSG
ncbi:MAG: HEPN domain-containing protein [Bacteroidaceae bacterium]|nr:HEPN domain-containing protein [Bacteroidaceae bacterium]